jgi:GT2 family glycosyltransferase
VRLAPIAAPAQSYAAMPAEPPRVIAIVNSFWRPPILARLLTSLATVPEIAGVIVVGSQADAETARVARESPLLRAYLPQAENVGLGAGLADGLRTALNDAAATHFLLLDDDVVMRPDAVTILWRAMDAAGAGAAVPVFVNGEDNVGWFPGVADRRMFRVLKRGGLTPAELQRVCGDAPVAFTWAPWPALLVTRDAVEDVGLPRADFCYMGEDLEYTLRLSWRRPALFVPTAIVAHLPPGRKAGAEAYFVDCMHLQNLAFIACRLPHGRRALRHLPGAIWRFLRGKSVRPAVMADLCRALWRGTGRGRPAGAAGADGFWKAYKQARPR